MLLFILTITNTSGETERTKRDLPRKIIAAPLTSFVTLSASGAKKIFPSQKTERIIRTGFPVNIIYPCTE